MCDLGQVGTRIAASARYLVRVTTHPSLVASQILKPFFPVIFWNECDPDSTGSLDRDAFVHGMVRIDEELRKTQLLGHASAGWNAASAAAGPFSSDPPLSFMTDTVTVFIPPPLLLRSQYNRVTSNMYHRPPPITLLCKKVHWKSGTT